MKGDEPTLEGTPPTQRPAAAELSTAAAQGSASRPPIVPGLKRGASVGRFIVVDRLGAGAMGEVVLAYDPDLHRRVAVKMLRGSLRTQTSGTAIARMLREARAMAKISHPNVITVFEVDQLPDGQSFIAMEYVDGGTLRTWAEREHTWHEVLTVYTQAGEGLAAAHEQGLMHRDFKPDNVLIGEDGRVRVTDFGLVGALDDDDAFLASLGHGESGGSSTTGRLAPSADATLTRTGSILGTPAYMAPEEAKELDTRSDQFSFCVALYEALYGERPYAGSSLAELRTNVCNGRRKPVPTDADVPRWLAEAVDRGLSTAPDDRWPDMRALLGALKTPPGQQRRRLLFGGVALALTSSALVYAASSTENAGPVCTGGRAQTEALWNDGRSQGLLTAFEQAAPNEAEAAHEAVVTAMDTFTQAWAAGHLDACEAHRVRGEQSDSMFDRRMLCLERKAEKVDAILATFAEADAGTVSAATHVQGAMPSVDTCADTEAMATMVPPPDVPAVRREWKRLHVAIDRADALGVSGRQTDALGAYAQIREAVMAVDHAPLQARYLQNYGNALIRVQKFTEAIDVLADAPEIAARAADGRIEANVWALLARAYGFGLEDAKAGAWMARAAEVAAVRSGDDPLTKLGIQHTQALLAEQSGDYARAVKVARRAVQNAEEVFGHAHRNTSAMYGTLGNALHKAGKFDEAMMAHQTSLEIDQGLHEGPHPDIGHSLINLGLLDEERGDLGAARVRYLEAKRIYEATVGKEHGAYGNAILNLASNAANRGDFDDARTQYLGVLAYYEKTLPEGHSDFGTVYVDLAEVALAQGELDEALERGREGLRVRVDSLGSEHPKVMLARTTLGRVLLARGEYEAAESELRAALKIADAGLDPDHVDRVDVLVALGEVLLATARGDEAKPILERAVMLAAEAPPGTLKRAQAALARAG